MRIQPDKAKECGPSVRQYGLEEREMAEADINSPKSADSDVQALRFERRSGVRLAYEGAATFFRLGGERFGEMHETRVLEYGEDGMSAVSDVPLAPGTLVSIGFENRSFRAQRGVVCRCSACPEGYRISVRFEGRAAA
jgi:hypothetical protein